MSWQRLLFFVLSVSLVLNIALFISYLANHPDIVDDESYRAQEKKYPLLSKRILKEFPQDVMVNFLSLRTILRQDLAPYGDSFGMYFEYLPTGTSININGTNEFHAASLFKLPVIMAYYHMRDRLHISDDPQITLTKDMIDNQFGDLWEKGSRYKLKASEAVKLALIDSDNTAARSLVPLIDKGDFNAVYEGLDIELESDKEGAILTAKSYSSILKALYFSAVLDKQSSQQILDLLTRTNFPDKLAAGVPANIPVAHKIGDYNDESGKEAFMDCGIIYLPRRPYLMCMVSISNEQVARDRMQNVSKTVYDYMTSIP